MIQPILPEARKKREKKGLISHGCLDQKKKKKGRPYRKKLEKKVEAKPLKKRERDGTMA